MRSTSAIRITVVLALGALALAASVSLAAVEGKVTIKLPPQQGGGSVSVALGELTGSVNGTYVVRTEKRDDGKVTGAVERIPVTEGIPLADILEKAGVDPDGFGHLQIERPTDGSVILSRKAIYDAGPLPPVIFQGADGPSFIRTSTSKEDFNASDFFALPGGAMAVRLREEGVLQAKISISPKKVAAGEPATFGAVVKNAPNGRKLTYEWDFGGARTAKGKEVEHTFKKKRSHTVTLTVEVPAEDLIAVATVAVDVGEAPADPVDEGGSGGSGGGSPGLPPIINTGPTGVSPTPDYAPIPSPGTTPVPGDGGLMPDEEPGTGGLADDGMIEGTLLADASTSPGPATAAALEAADFQPPDTTDGLFGLSAAAWVLIGALTLLGFGAGVEALRTRSRSTA